jgi:hypothetical protein
MPSENFEEFYFSFFDDSFGALHNGVNISALLALKGEELKKATNLILEAISVPDCDYRPIIGAGYLRLQEAVPRLEYILKNDAPERSSKLIWTARSLYQINQSQEALSIILDLFESVDSDKEFFIYSTTLEVIQSLKPTPEIWTALFSRMLNTDNPVLIAHRFEHYFGIRRIAFIMRMFIPWISKEEVTSNLQALDDIPKQERFKVEVGLLEKFKTTGSIPIATVLGLLGNKEAKPLIQKAFAESHKVNDRLLLSAALFRITNNKTYVDYIVEVLTSSQEYSDRWIAVDALASLPPTEVGLKSLLETAKNHDDPLGPWALVALKALFDDNSTIEYLFDKTFEGWKTSDPIRRLNNSDIEKLHEAVEYELSKI